MKRSKLYRTRIEAVDRQRSYSLEEAMALLKDMPSAKFDESVEIAFRLGIDPRQSDQIVRGAIVLPNGTGRTVRIVVFAEGEAAQQAQEAGADEVGFEELMERVKGGWVDFDVAIATPAAMRSVRTLGRILGPRGLMPNPKTGTLTDDPASAVREAKAGRVEYRCDRNGCVHMPVGKLSFTAEALVENATAALQTIQRARPASAKGTYLLAATVCSTMSPGIRVEVKNMVKV